METQKSIMDRLPVDLSEAIQLFLVLDELPAKQLELVFNSIERRVLNQLPLNITEEESTAIISQLKDKKGRLLNKLEA